MNNLRSPFRKSWVAARPRTFSSEVPLERGPRNGNQLYRPGSASSVLGSGRQAASVPGSSQNRSSGSTPLKRANQSTYKKNRATRQKQANYRRLAKRGNLGARKNGATIVRGTAQAILITGGLEVMKEGYLFFRKEGFTAQWKRKYVTFQGGLLKIFEPSVVESNQLFRRRSSGGNGWTLDDEAEEVIDILQLKKISYEKRKSRAFSLVSDPKGSVCRGAYQQQQQQVAGATQEAEKSEDGDSRMSRTYKTRSRGLSMRLSNFFQGNRRNGTLLPVIAGNSQKTFHFKGLDGTDGDNWVQAILYELRNQATFIDNSIKMLYDRNKVRAERDVNNIDGLHRQSVDLWALAKGKINEKTLDSMKQFVKFLDEFTQGGDELANWKQIVETVEQMINRKEEAKAHRKTMYVSTGLEELQELNEECFHSKSQLDYFFHPTEKLLPIRKKKSLKKQSPVQKMKQKSDPKRNVPIDVRLHKVSSTVSDSDPPAQWSEAEVEDELANEAETKEKAEEEEEEKEELFNLFKSARDIRKEREAEEERRFVMEVVKQKRVPNQLLELKEDIM